MVTYAYDIMCQEWESITAEYSDYLFPNPIYDYYRCEEYNQTYYKNPNHKKYETPIKITIL